MEKASNRIQLKICGLMRQEDVSLCREFGVHIAGFVTEYPLPVPWNLTAEEVKRLLRLVHAPMKSCLVTGGSREKILTLAEKLRPDFVQLHFRETLADTGFLAEALREFNIGVFKTLPFSPEERLAQFGTADIRECTELLNNTGISAILADSRAPSNADGAGTSADLGVFRQIRRYAEKPVILAGGVNPDNIAQILSIAQPERLDIMTGAETSPGVKDRNKIAAIMEQIR
ncbi:N-(5'-phosphoribosyl)anthranilate isomerase [bioreactor metagenome]|uniref:phosphoribosylanthranilate isomerase n=1 Tax=bioreactor metagenome TaxID=1076179 RepID=A0A644XF12_9ZZZZ